MGSEPVEARPGFKDRIDGASALAHPDFAGTAYGGMVQACAVEGGDGIVVLLAICDAHAGTSQHFASRPSDCESPTLTTWPLHVEAAPMQHRR